MYQVTALTHIRPHNSKPKNYQINSRLDGSPTPPRLSLDNAFGSPHVKGP